MKLTSRLKEIPGWIYEVEVSDHYDPNSELLEGCNRIQHPAVRYMDAHYLHTSGLIIAQCKMSFKIATEDLFKIEGENILMNFGFSGEISYVVDQLVDYQQTTLKNHSIAYSPIYDGRFYMPAGQQIHYVCIILSKDFYFALTDKRANYHRNFVKKVLKKEHTSFSPNPLPVTPDVRYVLAEIIAAKQGSRLRRLMLEAKLKELLVLQLEQFLRSGDSQSKHVSMSDIEINKLSEAKHILDMQFQQPPLIPELARKVCLNEFKLKQGFKALYGTSIYQYVIQQKMRHAFALLKSGKHTVGEITYEVGYRDIAHFSNAFLKYYGYRPKNIGKKAIILDP